jgi:type IV secretory pathway VirB9-like protein
MRQLIYIAHRKEKIRQQKGNCENNSKKAFCHNIFLLSTRDLIFCIQATKNHIILYHTNLKMSIIKSYFQKKKLLHSNSGLLY